MYIFSACIYHCHPSSVSTLSSSSSSSSLSILHLWNNVGLRHIYNCFGVSCKKHITRKIGHFHRHAWDIHLNRLSCFIAMILYGMLVINSNILATNLSIYICCHTGNTKHARATAPIYDCLRVETMERFEAVNRSCPWDWDLSSALPLNYKNIHFLTHDRCTNRHTLPIFVKDIAAGNVRLFICNKHITQIP